MTMSSTIFQTFKSKECIPLSTPDPKEQGPGIRRRLSSLSLKLQPMTSSSPAATAAASWAAFRRSKSVSSMGDYAGNSIKKWWGWSWDWILSRKPSFAKDLEMNEHEISSLGCHNRGSWRHVFYRLKNEITRLLGPKDSLDLPQTFHEIRK